MASNKLIVYQVFTRLYGNRKVTRKEYGTIEENGCGKLNDFTPTTLKRIREMPPRPTTPPMVFPVSILPS